MKVICTTKFFIATGHYCGFKVRGRFSPKMSLPRRIMINFGARAGVGLKLIFPKGDRCLGERLPFASFNEP
jgi:hypothetical protein